MLPATVITHYRHLCALGLRADALCYLWFQVCRQLGRAVPLSQVRPLAAAL